MKKTIGLIIILILTLITLTGCAEINYEVKVNKDGSGEISYIFGVSKEILENLNVSADDFIAEMKEQAEKSEYKVEAYEDDNIAGFKANKHLKDINKEFSLQEAFGEEYVKDTVDNRIKVEKSLFKTTYSQKAELDLTTLNEDEKEIKMTYKIKLPVTINSSNATEISEDGKTLKWNLIGGEINKIEFTAEETNILPIVIIASAVVLIVGVATTIVIIILKKKHVTKKEN